jgi:MFS family permease
MLNSGVEGMQGRRAAAFSYYLASQGISSLGDSFRFIAVTILIFKLTGSGMQAALGIAVSTLPSVFLSPFAGVLGDRIDEKRLLILTDFTRVLAVPLFLFADSVSQLYLLLILLSLFDIFYNPSRRKFILGMTGREGALKANSLLTGVSGAAYVVGPLAAGVLTDAFGPAPAILFDAFCCLISGFLTLGAGILYGREGRTGKRAGTGAGIAAGIVAGLAGFVGLAGRRTASRSARSAGGKQGLVSELRKGLEYSVSTPNLKSLLIIGFITGFCTISANLSFYPYAFDVLRVNARGWSMMITIYYGTNLVAMFLADFLGNRCKRSGGTLFYGGLCIVAVIWALYARIAVYAGVLALQFVEGTCIALCGILLAARFQAITEKSFMARVSGTNDIFTNVGKLAGMGCTAVITGSLNYAAVFALNSFVLFLFASAGLLWSRWTRNLT